MTTASDLVRQGLLLSCAFDPNEEIPGADAEQGLRVLNSIIDQWSSLGIYISTYVEYALTMVVGQYMYNVTPPITQIVKGHYYDSSNCLSILTPIDLKRHNTLNYLLSESATGYPTYVFADTPQSTVQTNSILYFYPVPSQAFVSTLYIKQRLAEFEYSDQVLNIPSFQFKALTYQMGRDLRDIYQTELSPEFYQTYETVINQLKAANKRDMTVNNRNVLNSNRRFRPWGTGYVG